MKIRLYFKKSTMLFVILLSILLTTANLTGIFLDCDNNLTVASHRFSGRSQIAINPLASQNAPSRRCPLPAHDFFKRS